jgi:two-component system NtrC family response regulator
VAQKKGRIELANKGTLFLDEIGELPLKLQAKLLRFLQEKKFERVGGHASLQITTRVICATNRDLESEVKAGRFREDLFYRINVVPITLPALKERTEDVLLLADHFLKQYSKEANKEIKGFTKEALYLLEHYEWPGNIRELENRIQRAVIMAQRELVDVGDLDLDGIKFMEDTSIIGGGPLSLKRAREEVDKQVIKQALVKNAGNISKTSRELEIDRNTLKDLMKKYGLGKEK